MPEGTLPEIAVIIEAGSFCMAPAATGNGNKPSCYRKLSIFARKISKGESNTSNLVDIIVNNPNVNLGLVRLTLLV